MLPPNKGACSRPIVSRRKRPTRLAAPPMSNRRESRASHGVPECQAVFHVASVHCAERDTNNQTPQPDRSRKLITACPTPRRPRRKMPPPGVRFLGPRARGTRRLYDVGERSAVKNGCCRVSHIQKYLVQTAMFRIPRDQASQLVGIAKGRQRPINQPDDLAQPYLGRRSPQLVTSLRPPYAFHQSRIPQLNQDHL